jgi:hypothetical protein
MRRSSRFFVTVFLSERDEVEEAAEQALVPESPVLTGMNKQLLRIANDLKKKKFPLAPADRK